MRVLLLGLLVIACQWVFAQDCLVGWDYYRSVSVNNPGAKSLTDIQIPIDIDAKTLLTDGKIQINGGDLRVLDENCNPLPYYLGINQADSSEKVWVKLASLPANDTVNLQLYYGNSTATSEIDGDATFIFFDDFSSGSVDPEKWETIGGFAKSEVNNGVYEYASDGMNPGPRFKFVRTKVIFSEEVEFDFRAKVSNSNGFGFSSADTILDRLIYRQSGFGFDTLNQVAFNKDTVNNGFSISQSYPIIRFPRGEYRDGNIRAGVIENIFTTTRFNNLDDMSLDSDTFQVIQSPMSGFHFILSSFINSTVFLDYIRVRQILPAEVNVTLGEEEESIANSISFPGSNQVIDIYPNPAKNVVNLRGMESGAYQIRLINAQGQDMYQQSHQINPGEEIQINLDTLPDGMYWLLILNQKSERIASPLVIRK
ncbi:MAG: DUF2341 domain-containing protein [Bacteroidota bacterium]